MKRTKKSDIDLTNLLGGAHGRLIEIVFDNNDDNAA